jgi:NADH-quinone oxidoreductase subunit M
MMADYGGIARIMPVYATIFVIVTLSSIGLPGLNGFVGEFLILAGTFKTQPVYAIIAASGVILAAMYMLWLVMKVFFGPVTHEENRAMPDMKWNELAAVLPLLLFIVWIGVRPNDFLRKMTPSVKQLMTHVKTVDTEQEAAAPAVPAVPAEAHGVAR